MPDDQTPHSSLMALVDPRVAMNILNRDSGKLVPLCPACLHQGQNGVRTCTGDVNTGGHCKGYELDTISPPEEVISRIYDSLVGAMSS